MNELIFTNTRDVVPTLRSELELNGLEFMASAGNAIGEERKCKELLGASFKILDWSDREEMVHENGLNLMFLKWDFIDRISPGPVNPGKAIDFDTTGALKPFLRDPGMQRSLYLVGNDREPIFRVEHIDRSHLDYTYSERMWYQYEPVIEILKSKSETRQAYISIWNPSIDISRLEKKRVPCSIGYQFFVREGKLNVIYLMRSLEVSKCLGNDIYTSSRLLEFIADKVGVECGFLQFSVGSLHIFE